MIETDNGGFKETRWRFVEGSDIYVDPGKEIQFYHSVTKDDRALIWFRPHQPPAETCSGPYPFMLSTGRVLEHWHTGTMTRRVQQLSNAMPKAYLEMNADDAREMGIANGEEVELRTVRGRMRLPVWLNGRAKPQRGALFVPFFDESAPINDLTLDAVDPYSKQPDYKKSAARVTKIADLPTSDAVDENRNEEQP